MNRYTRAIMALLFLLSFSTVARPAAVIQEVLYDGPGSDADDVFIELFGSPGALLDGWSLVGINGSNGDVYRTIDLSGMIIPVDGIFVIATASASAALAAERDMAANVDWQNGPDAIRLLDGDTVIDALQYGDAGPFNAGEGNFAIDVTGATSLSRDLFATDTGDNALDFSAAIPTPGSGPAVVPVPAAVWLFGSGLALLSVFQRRQRFVLFRVNAEA